MSNSEPARLTKSDVDRVRDAASRNINMILAHYGAKWSGRKLHCPWPSHADAHPSATIRNGYIKCWSCDQGGDAFDLIKAHEHCDFPQAVRKAAQILGINLP